ncbi:MAG: ABC transporter permease [Gemmatimonadetes bacterium]|nr:ABC transporter permease [Gemmatimonadota bacterium]
MGETIRVALGAIRANAMRSALTTLGIIIGVAAVIAMVALGEGAQRRVQDQIAAMGTNVLTIRPGQNMFRGVSRGDARLFVEDAEALQAGAGGSLMISPEVRGRQQVSYLRWNVSNDVIGVWPDYFAINNFKLAAGRLFDEGEVQGRRRVAVVGSEVPTQLGDTPPTLLVGRTIQIRGVPFEIVGVLEEKGAMGFSRPDDDVFIPLSTAQYRVMGGRDRLNAIYAQVQPGTTMDAAFATIDRVVRREHRLAPGEDADFNISNQTDILETFNESNEVFGWLLAGIAAVSLLVGGIGIMNIMLVSVTERTREIGVRKALGATRRTVLMQFLIEALVLCTLGGIIGVGVGVGGATALTNTLGWETAVRMDAVLIALGFSAGIGLFFGIWPAQRAAKLDPIESLRYE